MMMMMNCRVIAWWRHPRKSKDNNMRQGRVWGFIVIYRIGIVISLFIILSCYSYTFERSTSWKLREKKQQYNIAANFRLLHRRMRTNRPSHYPKPKMFFSGILIGSSVYYIFSLRVRINSVIPSEQVITFMQKGSLLLKLHYEKTKNYFLAHCKFDRFEWFFFCVFTMYICI